MKDKLLIQRLAQKNMTHLQNQPTSHLFQWHHKGSQLSRPAFGWVRKNIRMIQNYGQENIRKFKKIKNKIKTGFGQVRTSVIKIKKIINKIKPGIGHHRQAWTSLSTTLCVTMSIKFIIMLPCHHVNQVDHHVTMTNKLILCHHIIKMLPCHHNATMST